MQTSYLPAERDNFSRGQMLAFNARVPRDDFKKRLTNSQRNYKICLKNTPEFLARKEKTDLFERFLKPYFIDLKMMLCFIRDSVGKRG